MDADKESAEKWILKPSPKCETFGTPRTIPSKDTIERVLPLMNKLNVNIEEDIKRVDTDDIPVFVIKRTGDGNRDFYHKGKGYSKNDSLASAIMEAVERYSAERFDDEVIYCSYEEILSVRHAINPDDLYARVTPNYKKEMKVDWVKGFDLISQCETYAPLSLVVNPYVSRPEPFCSCSVGLASGNTMEEALSHALCEVIEHDSITISSLYNPWMWNLNCDLTKDFSMESFKEDPTPNLSFPLIDIKTFPERAADVAGKLHNAGLIVFARNTTTDIGVPSVYCTVVKQCADGTHVYYEGMGTHPDAEIAILRALCEAAQSHASIEWLMKMKLLEPSDPLSTDPYELHGYGSRCRFSDIYTYKNASVDEDIRFILERLEAAGLDQVVSIDLTRREIGIPVVRVVIPKTEYLPTEFCNPVLGPRAKKALGIRAQQYAASLLK